MRDTSRDRLRLGSEGFGRSDGEIIDALLPPSRLEPISTHWRELEEILGAFWNEARRPSG